MKSVRKLPVLVRAFDRPPPGIATIKNDGKIGFLAITLKILYLGIHIQWRVNINLDARNILSPISSL